MNTQYTQYVNEARAAQHQQALQQEAAAERALRAAQRELQEQVAPATRPSNLRRLLGALAARAWRRQPGQAAR